MSIKVNFEIGHEASVRTKRTPEGFTHDWEVFVRGVDNAEISQFVEKVVFQLHETFPKPRRPVKEPPYCVKESGYAGFNLPIEIYLKNPDEPKKIQFNYDLNLQQSGPPIIKVQKERHVFHHPAEDFRKKLLRGGGMITSSNPFLPVPSDQERSSRDSFTDDKPQPLIGKPKLGGDSKKSKTKDYETHRPLNHFENLFGTPIRISPDSKKPSPSPKQDKLLKEKEKEKLTKSSKHENTKEHREDKQKVKVEKERIKDEKERIKDEKERLKEEKRSSKGGKDRELNKEKSGKRSAERPLSPAPSAKKPAVVAAASAPIKVNPPSTPKDDAKPSKHESETKNKTHSKPSDTQITKVDKKAKKEKRSHDKEREGKKEHKKDKESKASSAESKETKPKDVPKEVPVKEVKEVKDKEKPPNKPGKITIQSMLKDPVEPVKHETKHKDKGDRERKHKHKKKDKKRDGSREKNKESSSKDKKHKHDKSSGKSKNTADVKEPEKPEPVREIEKVNTVTKAFKDKERMLTISPISVDTSSQSSSKSVSKSKVINNPLTSMMNELSCGSNSDSNASLPSDDENNSMHSENNSRSNMSKASTKQSVVEPPKVEPQKVVAAPETTKPDKITERPSQGSGHKKSKEKMSKYDAKEEKKRKRNSNSKVDESESSKKVAKVSEEPEHSGKSSKRVDVVENVKDKPKIDSPRIKTDTKVQDDGVSSSLSDHPLKCESPISEEVSQTVDRKQMTADYMTQLKELQHKIMTIKSSDELERVVNLIAETGKFEVTKKTFDFDLCLLDRTTVQQLQEMIGCESRA